VTVQYGGTEVRCVCFYLSHAHDIISQSENTESRLKLADSRNDINILLYFNAECRYLHCWIL